jgi:hypothetical protein
MYDWRKIPITLIMALRGALECYREAELADIAAPMGWQQMTVSRLRGHW